MCVAVTMAPGSELTIEEIIKMGNANGDGFGFAWAEDGAVHWFKTLVYDADYLTNLVNEYKEFPRLVHFRLTTVGGVQIGLCHPFEIGPMAAFAPTGHGQRVLIHNGHWYRAGDIHDILKKEGALPDHGPWSDTRLAAFLASHDEDWLTTVTGKVATLDGEGHIKLFGDWTELREGIKVSNKLWDHNYDYKRSGLGRRWEGWGWTEKNWQQKEAHDAERAAAAQKEKEEKEKASESEKQQKTRKGTSEDSEDGERDRVGSGPRHRQVSTPDSPRASGVGRYRGPGETGTKEGQGGKEQTNQRIYDYTPFQNPETGIWYQVDPTADNSKRPHLRQLTEAEAFQLMEQAASSGSPSGD